MDHDFDLLGDPVPENFGKRGRPPHIPTIENRNKVRMLLAFGWMDKRIAAALRVTVPTLRKHYFRELRQRDEARPALQANHMMMIYRAAQDGNVGAMKELGRLIEKDELSRPQARVRPEEPKAEKIGKKEAAERAANKHPEGTGWSNLLN